MISIIKIQHCFNVGSLILSASRFKYRAVCPSKSQTYLFDFLVNALQSFGGVPEEIFIDNVSTMMDKARSESSVGKVNQLIDRCYEKKSTIVTSNINLSDWNQIFVDNMLAFTRWLVLVKLLIMVKLIVIK